VATIYEEEAHMKIGPQLFAIVAFGALPTQVAVAGHHHGHRASGSAAPSHSGTDPQNLAKFPTVKDSQQGSGPAVQGGIADHGNGEAAKDGSALIGADKGIVDGFSAHTKKSGKTGVSIGSAPDIAPAAAHGPHGAATPSPGTGGKLGDAGADIDIRITVHQGREPIKGSNPFKKTKIVTTPRIALGHEPVHNFHQWSPVGSDAAPHRNAIGAIVVHDKAVEHGHDLAHGAVAPITTTVAAPHPAAIIHDHNMKPIIGNAPINNSSFGTTQIDNHASDAAAALKVVTANGPSISGTAMIRPGFGAAALGGPAKIAAGGLSGNSFRPRHP
jgi:hypothetical protein